MQVPARIEGGYRDLIERIMEMAAAEERERREHQEPREPSEALGWKVGSSTPSER